MVVRPVVMVVVVVEWGGSLPALRVAFGIIGVCV